MRVHAAADGAPAHATENPIMPRQLLSLALLLGSVATHAVASDQVPADLTPQEARAIAKEAYVYGYPMVDGYRILHAYFVDERSPEHKGPWNTIHNMARVFTPDDKVVQTPNSDTPYSMVGLDLRTEPVVLTLPAIEKERYVSAQLVDLYTHNFAYLGSRTTGNGGGSFLVAGPGWQGATPAGITQVVRCETELLLVIYRTQLFHPGDLDNVKKVQSGYRAQSLSAFLGQPAPKAAPALAFVTPLTPAAQKTSLEVFHVLNFLLQFCPTVASEQGLMARFARIGVGAGRTFDASKLDAATKQAMAAGIADAWSAFDDLEKNAMDTGKVTSGDLFGTRDYLANNYLYRMAAAVLGIYGNSKAEAMYPIYTVDAAGWKLDASKARYVLRFAPGQLPPANAFWSLTMYELPASLLTANALDRYLVNSPMLPQLQRDADGGLTLYVQHASPGKDRESNWLPAPAGPFMAVLRLYWPKEEAIAGRWQQPLLEVVKDD